MRKSALLAKIVGFSCKMFVFVENALIFAPIFVRGDTEKPALCALEVRFLEAWGEFYESILRDSARFCACLLLEMFNI